MRVVEGHVGHVEPLDDLEPLHQRRERSAAIDGFVYAPARHREVEMVRVARVDDDRMELRAVGCPSCTVPIHSRYFGSSLIGENGAQVTPPSSERKRPCGEVPAYQTPGWLAWAGASQNV